MLYGGLKFPSFDPESGMMDSMGGGSVNLLSSPGGREGVLTALSDPDRAGGFKRIMNGVRSFMADKIHGQGRGMVGRPAGSERNLNGQRAAGDLLTDAISRLVRPDRDEGILDNNMRRGVSPFGMRADRSPR
jgi:hypothetical protein